MASFSATLICLLSLLSAIATIDGGKSTVRTQPKIHPERSDVDGRSSDLLASVLPKDCGRRFSVNGRVSGGYTARLGEFPSFVRVDILVKSPTGNYTNSCAGTLISDRHVLTVAHCLRHTTIGVQVYTTIKGPKPNGGDDASLMYPANKLCISSKYIHNVKLEQTHHDLALVRLARPVKFSRKVQPACLPGIPSEGKDKLREVGLGYTWMSSPNETEVHSPEYLQALPVKYTPCRDPGDQHWSKFCVYPEDPWFVGSTCAGDSGSPIYGFENGRIVVVGMTAYATAVCEQGVVATSVKTDVYATRHELAELMKECQ